MKLLIKIHSNIVLFTGVLLFSCEVFSASEATKKLIHDTLSKYCVPNDKTVCNTQYEEHYDPNYDFCLCEDGMVYNKSKRKCVLVPAGTYYQKSIKTNIPQKCGIGTYQDEIGKRECKNCDINACYEVRNNRTSCDYKCGDYDVCSNGNCMKCTLDTNNWKEIVFSGKIGDLEPGIYKIVVAGGGGGKGSHVNTCSGRYSTRARGGSGGGGHVLKDILRVDKTTSYSFSIGSKGVDRGYTSTGHTYTTRWFVMDSGGNGGDSVLVIGNKKYVAGGGGGGASGGSKGCSLGSTYNGSQGSNAGNGENSGSGYVNIYKCQG